MIEQSVKKFIEEYWNYNMNKLKTDTTLDDIGMYGDDKYDFLIEFSKEFLIDMKEFPYEKYIDDEGDFLGIGTFIKSLIFKNKERVIEKITIGMLVDWVERGKI